MRIFVRNENQRSFIPIKVKDLGNELERITVRIGALVEKKFHRNDSNEDIKRKQLFWQKIFKGLYEKAAHNDQAQSGPDGKTVVINISLPNMRFSNLYRGIADKFKSADAKYKAASIALSAIIILVVGHSIFSGGGQRTGNQNEDDRAALIAKNNTVRLPKGTPKFDTILPAGKNINELGGWTRVSPPNRNPVYAYTDKVGSAKLAVSEQPLPKKLKTDTDSQVAKVAQNFNAYDKLTSGKTLAYIGTSENGQSIILSKADLLILIRSTSFLNNSQWAAYINSLK
ncbi:MAG TPA: hypothetical protein VFW77_03350 [Candidatus Saccharimonadales bacterium]|nr:hypothetical protein [Candidatus Saccharimonadales bacterium]